MAGILDLKDKPIPAEKLEERTDRPSSKQSEHQKSSLDNQFDNLTLASSSNLDISNLGNVSFAESRQNSPTTANNSTLILNQLSPTIGDIKNNTSTSSLEDLQRQIEELRAATTPEKIKERKAERAIQSRQKEKKKTRQQRKKTNQPKVEQEALTSPVASSVASSGKGILASFTPIWKKVEEIIRLLLKLLLVLGKVRLEH